jgi:SAM-dependent methyltransferase
MSFPDFTGERFIPGQGGSQIAYEHLHRYRFALGFSAGKRVLDVAAGDGYGSALLATSAKSVWAIDRDEVSVQYARNTYGSDHLLFARGDALSLPLLSRSMEVVVAMEVLEHVEDQEKLVEELSRVVTRGGVVLISTPNKAIYSDARNYHNPFHIHELYRDEFLALLGRHFDVIQIVEQQVRAGSLILNPDDRTGGSEILAQPAGPAAGVGSMYFLAVCGIGREAVPVPSASAFLDTGDTLLVEWEARLLAAGSEVERLNQEVLNLGSWGRGLEKDLHERDLAIQRIREELAREIAAREAILSQLRSELNARAEWARRVEESVRERDRTIEALQEEMAREITRRDQAYERLHGEFVDRGRWAQSLSREIEVRNARNEDLKRRFVYRILAKIGFLPQ